MTKKQIKHIERKLIQFIDNVTDERNTTTTEVEVLPEVVLALIEIHRMNL